uniref:Uncharacterized protein n=1 Tax=Anguilla anguilla TaxID=7936 RepID=A0A0E9PY73_ANGAN
MWLVIHFLNSKISLKELYCLIFWISQVQNNNTVVVTVFCTRVTQSSELRVNFFSD